MAGRSTSSLVPVIVVLVFLLAGLVAGAPSDAHLVGAAADDIVPHGTMLRRALQTTTSESECAAEQIACTSDASCPECSLAFGGALLGDCGDVDDDATCSDAQEAFCCAIDVASDDCIDNDAFDDWIGCQVENSAFLSICEVEISDCSGASGRSSSWGAACIFLCSTAVAGALVSTFGIVV